jgi:hypothetical protein
MSCAMPMTVRISQRRLSACVLNEVVSDSGFVTSTFSFVTSVTIIAWQVSASDIALL